MRVPELASEWCKKIVSDACFWIRGGVLSISELVVEEEGACCRGGGGAGPFRFPKGPPFGGLQKGCYPNGGEGRSQKMVSASGRAGGQFFGPAFGGRFPGNPGGGSRDLGSFKKGGQGKKGKQGRWGKKVANLGGDWHGGELSPGRGKCFFGKGF